LLDILPISFIGDPVRAVVVVVVVVAPRTPISTPSQATSLAPLERVAPADDDTVSAFSTTTLFSATTTFSFWHLFLFWQQLLPLLLLLLPPLKLNSLNLVPLNCSWPCYYYCCYCCYYCQQHSYCSCQQQVEAECSGTDGQGTDLEFWVVAGRWG